MSHVYQVSPLIYKAIKIKHRRYRTGVNRRCNNAIKMRKNRTACNFGLFIVSHITELVISDYLQFIAIF